MLAASMDVSASVTAAFGPKVSHRSEVVRRCLFSLLASARIVPRPFFCRKNFECPLESYGAEERRVE